MGAGLRHQPGAENFEETHILDAMSSMKEKSSAGMYLDVDDLAEKMQNVFTAGLVDPELAMSSEAREAILASFNKVTNEDAEALQRWSDALARLLVLDDDEERDRAVYILRDGVTKQEVEDTLLLAAQGPQN